MSLRGALNAALAAVLSLVLAAGFIEVAVRVVFDDGMDFALEMWKYARRIKRVAADPVIAHEHVPNSAARLMGVDVSINSHGLRDREIIFDKPPQTIRIALLGDSVTFGWGVEYEHTIGIVLAQELNATRTNSNIETINMGVGNYNSSMQVQYFLTQGHRYSPDYVVLNFFINDAEETPTYTGHFLNEHSFGWVFLAGRIDILRRLIGASRPWKEYYSALYADDAAGWRLARDAIMRLGAWCQEQNVPCLLANLPELHAQHDYPFLDVNHKLEGLAAEAGLEYLELLPSVRGQPEESLWVSAADPHPNAKAFDLYGRALADYLRPRISQGDAP